MMLRKKQLSLGKLIDKLSVCDKTKPVWYDFGRFVPSTIDSYRGFYDQLAIGYTERPFDDSPTVETVLTMCENAVGSRFQGYKGGTYWMDRDTPMWVANYGESGHTTLSGVVDAGWAVILKTRYDDE